jgi:hypothetical protein
MVLDNYRFLILGVFLASITTLKAAEPPYSPDVTKWVEVKAPSRANVTEWYIFSTAGNYSKHEWQVYLHNGRVSARPSTRDSQETKERPSFATSQEGIGNGYAFEKVTDGWLVGFNAGEWGGALYWYSEDGSSNYKISDSQAVSFYRVAGVIYAIEGLAHLDLGEGSVILIHKNGKDGKWTELSYAKLPRAPAIACVHRNGLVTITTSDSIVSVDDNRKVRTLLANAPWPMFYPNSAVLTPNEKKLYIGMREYVGEFDLTTRKLRLLVPSIAYRNRLPKDKEAGMRKAFRQYEKEQERKRAKRLKKTD